MKKQWLMIGMLCVGGLLGCKKPAPSEPVENAVAKISVVLPQATTLTSEIKVSGSFVAKQLVGVGTSLQGKQVLSVNADVGSVVKKGQVLASLESSTVQSQLEQQEANLVRVKANLAAQEAALKEAKTTLARYQKLVVMDAVSRQEFDQQTAKAQTAMASVQTAKAEITQIQAQIKDSRHERTKAQVIAPVSGVITKRAAQAGALTGADALFEIAQDGVVELEVQANTDELVKLQIGLPARVQFKDSQHQITGKVRLISPEMDASNRLGKVRIALDNARNIPIGAYAEATIQLPNQQANMTLPFSAVSFGGSETTVMVVNAQGIVERRVITVGSQAKGLVEVLSGLQKTEKVVRQAGAFVSEGDKVEAQLVQDKEK